jgi:Domain of unknown function (DUF4249)
MVRPARRPLAARVLALGAFLQASIAGCEIKGTTAPELEPRVVVHAVLNPTSGVQIITVERTVRSLVRTSSETPPYDPIDDALVVIYGARGDSVVARRATGTGVSPGVYRVSSITITDGSADDAQPNVLRIRPGERYRLRVETSIGVAAGETTIPVAGSLDGSRIAFNLDHDTLRVDTTGVRNAAGYYLRHEWRRGVDERYVTSLDGALLRPPSTPADSDWAFSFAGGTIYPGLAQRFTLVAVDSNYFRYYVAGFDPFGDDTRGNTLTGGVGLFGSVAPVVSKILDLTADADTPMEGSWAADSQSPTMPTALVLYASPSFPREGNGKRISLSGTGLVSGKTVEAYGTNEGDGTVLLFFAPIDESSSGTTATGSLSGEDLVLTDSRTGERVTYRRR